jgi:hypothetical protein
MRRLVVEELQHISGASLNSSSLAVEDKQIKKN